MDYEAFVYLWFDSKNRKFYLGYHKGHEDDSYTHSSTVLESFSKTAVPSHMRRRILARGSDEEMRQLEKDLLDNRKERCWDKYYNVIAAFPPPPRYGEDNNLYVHGKWGTAEYHREKSALWYAENREAIREQQQIYREENREKIRENDRKYQRKYREKNPEKIRENDRVRKRKYREENREKIRENDRKYYHRKKAEKMGTSTLDDFFGN